MDEGDDSPIPSPAHSRRSSVSLTSTSLLPNDGLDNGFDDGLMPLPPEGHFPSFEALERHAQDHARNHGYAVSSIR